MDRPRIRTFSVHCREHYGQTLGKIPLDLGIPCPNRIKGGCIFCRPASFTPYSLRATDPISVQIHRGKTTLLKGRHQQYLGYFQQETPTALATSRLIPLLAEVLDDPACRGLILSTRPDAIAGDLPSALAQLIQDSGKTCLIELGLQSIHQRSLHLLNRHHSYADVTKAVDQLRSVQGLDVGVHLMLGVPGETTDDMLTTVATVCALPIQALKIHHLQIIRQTTLHRLYQDNRVEVFTVEAYLELLLSLLPHIPAHITLHRLWSTAHPHLLVAPRWHILTAALSVRLNELMRVRNLWQGQLAEDKGNLSEQGAQQ